MLLPILTYLNNKQNIKNSAMPVLEKKPAKMPFFGITEFFLIFVYLKNCAV
jgi:hypothetical protein